MSVSPAFLPVLSRASRGPRTGRNAGVTHRPASAREHRVVERQRREDPTTLRVVVRVQLKKSAVRVGPTRVRRGMVAAQRFPISIILVTVGFEQTQPETRKGR